MMTEPNGHGPPRILITFLPEGEIQVHAEQLTTAHLIQAARTLLQAWEREEGKAAQARVQVPKPRLVVPR